MPCQMPKPSLFGKVHVAILEALTDEFGLLDTSTAHGTATTTPWLLNKALCK